MKTMPTLRACLARKAYFSCAHRYFNPSLSEKENRSLYGSLYSEYGLGHNFVVEAHFEGPLRVESGLIVNIREIDAILKEVVAILDHRHLNMDVPYFSRVVPTPERIAEFLYHQIAERARWPEVKLIKVRLFEGEDLWIDYGLVDSEALPR